MITIIRLLWYLILFLAGTAELVELVLSTQIQLGNAFQAVTLLLRQNQNSKIYIGNPDELRIYDYETKVLDNENKTLGLIY